jgi:hypothetical protein
MNLVNFRFFPVLSLSVLLVITGGNLPTKAATQPATIAQAKKAVIYGQLPSKVINLFAGMTFPKNKVAVKSIPNGGGIQQHSHAMFRDVLKDGTTKVVITMCNEQGTCFSQVELRISKTGQASFYRGWNSANRLVTVRIEQSTQSLKNINLNANRSGEVVLTPGSKLLGKLDLKKGNIAIETGFPPQGKRI